MNTNSAGRLLDMPSMVTALNESARPPVNRALDTGIAALTIAILLVSLGGVVQMNLEQAAVLVLLIAVFSFMYFFGAMNMRELNPMGRFLWLAGLSGVWVVAMMFAPIAVYWVFTLFFLYMRAFSNWVGVIGVIVMLAMSIGFQVPRGLTFGGVMLSLIHI